MSLLEVLLLLLQDRKAVLQLGRSTTAAVTVVDVVATLGGGNQLGLLLLELLLELALELRQIEIEYTRQVPPLHRACLPMLPRVPTSSCSTRPRDEPWLASPFTSSASPKARCAEDCRPSCPCL